MFIALFLLLLSTSQLLLRSAWRKSKNPNLLFTGFYRLEKLGKRPDKGALFLGTFSCRGNFPGYFSRGFFSGGIISMGTFFEGILF